jgi:two-component system phosphate regulon sensor histidine kinase PhoR
MSTPNRPDKLRLSALLMALTIIGIAAFQGYWIKKLYDQEWNDLKRETDVAFRDVVYKLQIQHFRKDSAFFNRHLPDNLFLFNVLDSIRYKFGDSRDSGAARHGARRMTISIETDIRHDSAGGDSFPQGLASLRSLPAFPDSSLNSLLSIGQIDSAYKKELQRSAITVPYTIQRVEGGPDADRTIPVNRLKTNFLFVGLSKSYAYQASFGSPIGYILKRIRLPVSMALLLLLFTTASLVFLYRNLRQQQRLAAIKNEFISNMTHELKTPISTVRVAVEALRHFDALDDPQKTREYLDISALELQRLSMLVDKVLKLSLFENKEISVNLTSTDLHELAAEVIASMKLQFEKAGALIQLTRSLDHPNPANPSPSVVHLRAPKPSAEAPGGLPQAMPWSNPFQARVDRMHLSSVLSNLLDNALKYSKADPAITVHLSRHEDFIVLAVSDNGIGIPSVYTSRIFEKFFRVPSGDHHNIKGYGLGLSYVRHIIASHNGSISVESKEGKGSVFTVQLPAE